MVKAIVTARAENIRLALVQRSISVMGQFFGLVHYLSNQIVMRMDARYIESETDGTSTVAITLDPCIG